MKVCHLRLHGSKLIDVLSTSLFPVFLLLCSGPWISYLDVSFLLIFHDWLPLQPQLKQPQTFESKLCPPSHSESIGFSLRVIYSTRITTAFMSESEKCLRTKRWCLPPPLLLFRETLCPHHHHRRRRRTLSRRLKYHQARLHWIEMIFTLFLPTSSETLDTASSFRPSIERDPDRILKKS